MNINRNLPKVTVTEKCRKRTAYGHPWIYDNEVVSADEITDGELADVVSEKNRYIGTGFYNSKSKIRVRIISRSTNDKFDEDFFRRRLQYAYDYRKTVMSHEDMTACRLIFGEGDSFPGLTVDRFNNLLSVQILSLGIEKRRDIILPALLDILRNDGCMTCGLFVAFSCTARVSFSASATSGSLPVSGTETRNSLDPTRNTSPFSTLSKNLFTYVMCCALPAELASQSSALCFKSECKGTAKI